MEINAIIYGATGMVGSGVLIECLKDPVVKSVLVIGRRSCEEDDPKLKEIILTDFEDYSAIEGELAGYNACFYCLGVTSFRMSEAGYTKVTYDYTMKAANVLALLNPGMTFIFVSGAGTRDDGKSRLMWARVKGATERDLKAVPFKHVFNMRPAFIQPTAGVKRVHLAYRFATPLVPFIKRLFPNIFTTTKVVGRAMINAVMNPPDNQTLESRDISRLGG